MKKNILTLAFLSLCLFATAQSNPQLKKDTTYVDKKVMIRQLKKENKELSIRIYITLRNGLNGAQMSDYTTGETITTSSHYCVVIQNAAPEIGSEKIKEIEFIVSNGEKLTLPKMLKSDNAERVWHLFFIPKQYFDKQLTVKIITEAIEYEPFNIMISELGIEDWYHPELYK